MTVAGLTEDRRRAIQCEAVSKEENVAVSLTERCILLEDFMVVPPSAWHKGVVEKEFSFWRKSAGLGNVDTCSPRLASFP